MERRLQGERVTNCGFRQSQTLTMSNIFSTMRSWSMQFGFQPRQSSGIRDIPVARALVGTDLQITKIRGAACCTATTAAEVLQQRSPHWPAAEQ
eukprot:6178550-Pleurochrysis_carterae.AAC.4